MVKAVFKGRAGWMIAAYSLIAFSGFPVLTGCGPGPGHPAHPVIAGSGLAVPGKEELDFARYLPTTQKRIAEYVDIISLRVTRASESNSQSLTDIYARTDATVTEIEKDMAASLKRRGLPPGIRKAVIDSCFYWAAYSVPLPEYMKKTAKRITWNLSAAVCILSKLDKASMAELEQGVNLAAQDTSSALGDDTWEFTPSEYLFAALQDLEQGNPAPDYLTWKATRTYGREPLVLGPEPENRHHKQKGQR